MSFSLKEVISMEKLEAFCRKHHINRLSLFGSALKNELKPHSDIDILVEFEEGYTPGLITFAGIEIELSSLAGRKVDLRTPGDLSVYFRDEVVSMSKVIYAPGR